MDQHHQGSAPTKQSRSDFFRKDGKVFALTHFAAPLLVATCAAAFSIKTKSTAMEQMLSRDVTDEWKGWMQYVLLVYHASGASGNLPIYMHVRVIVSAYLFLTGYGHFSRYWRTGNAGGFTRYCQVMFRLNFLTVLLCLVMGQPYMNYYFVVLVSFWYTVLHLVMASPPHLTDAGQERTSSDFARAALKITIVTVTIGLLSNFEVFETVFGWRHLGRLFRLQSHPGVLEWRFRWMLDRFSVLYGMIFALMCQGWTRFWPNNIIGSRWPTTKLGTALLAALSLSTFVCHPLLLRTCDSKQACNDLHPYFTWIPILGYIFFRHHCSFFRSHFCSLFAFLGQISLELFVSQYHILLASNTHSLLVLVPGQPIINTVVTGLVFLCTAHEISNITGDLQPTLAPSDGKKMLRNLLVAGAAALLLVFGSMIW